MAHARPESRRRAFYRYVRRQTIVHGDRSDLPRRRQSGALDQGGQRHPLRSYQDHTAAVRTKGTRDADIHARAVIARYRLRDRASVGGSIGRLQTVPRGLPGLPEEPLAGRMQNRTGHLLETLQQKVAIETTIKISGLSTTARSAAPQPSVVSLHPGGETCLATAQLLYRPKRSSRHPTARLFIKAPNGLSDGLRP